MQVTSRARRIGVACLTALAVTTPGVAHAATAAERNAAVADGAAYLRSLVQPSGKLGGPSAFGDTYALSSLAAAGIHPADVVAAGSTTSAQDHYAASFAALTTPSSTAVLFGTAAGIDTQRLAPQTNLVASLASAYNADGSYGNGGAGIQSFTTIAMARVGAPAGVLAANQAFIRTQQHTDGGFNLSKVTTEALRTGPGDVDVTGQMLAALCETSAGVNDSDVRGALSFLRGRQDPATGGFGNSDSTAWVLSALNACGIAFDAARFTTSTGQTPSDALIADQQPDGSFTYEGDPNLYSTQNAVRALAGESFAADPPRRANPADARLRTPAAVAAGTVTPHALAIDDGAGTVRFCRVDAPAGAALADVLAAAQTASTPAGCVTSFSVGGGSVTAVNGAAGSWSLEVDRRTAEAAGATRSIAFGDTVALRRASPAGGGSGGQGPAGQDGTNGTNGVPGAAGPAGPTGPAGAPGANGAAGGTGATGPAGPRGRTGRRGPRGRTLRCTVRGSRVRCRAAVKARSARLTRGGRVYARGTAARLRAVRRVRAGRYTLRSGRRTWAVRVG